MRPRRAAALLAALAGLALAAGGPQHLQVGRWSVQWTQREASAQGPGGAATLYGPPAPRACPQGAAPSTVRGAVLALVGPYTSVYTETRDDCGAHPSVERTFSTTSLRRPDGAPLSLLDLFLERDVLNALLADPQVRRAVADAPRPASVRALGQAYGSFGCTVLDEGALQNFAFYDLQGARVAVRLSLPEAAYSCRPGFTQLALSLPVPAALRADLSAAKRAGALMVNLQARTDLLP